MNNLALLPKNQQQAILTHKKQCLRNHYYNLDKGQALTIKSSLQRYGKSTEKSKKFIKRVNYARGYEFI